MDDDMEDAPAAAVDDAQKTALVQAEVQRMKCLPPSSAYVIHRLKVLNKMLELLSKVRISRTLIALTLCSMGLLIAHSRKILALNSPGYKFLSTGANEYGGGRAGGPLC